MSELDVHAEHGAARIDPPRKALVRFRRFHTASIAAGSPAARFRPRPSIPCMPGPVLHSVTGLWPPLEVMRKKGFDVVTCLEGTHLSEADLRDHHNLVTYEQELRFYGNLLDLTGDPTIGLELGAAYEPQRYGLYSYAMHSAGTCGQAMQIGIRFIDLTFSWFNAWVYAVERDTVYEFRQRHEMPERLFWLFADRDLTGIVALFNRILGFTLPLKSLQLPHSGHDRRRRYKDHFGCDIVFDESAKPSMRFPTSVLDSPLPQSDPASAELLVQQCQVLLSKVARGSKFADEVKRLILSSPHSRTNIDLVAGKMNLSSRTLRRHLTQEGTSYQDVLDEVRFQLAKEYLSETRLSLQEITDLLGYSEPGTFTHAFRRWSGVSPSEYRQGREPG